MSSIRKEAGIWTYTAWRGKRRVHRSLQTGDHRVALDRQKVLDAELGASQWTDPRTRWEDWKRRYLDWSKVRKPHASYKNEELSLARFERVARPVLMRDVTRAQAEGFVTALAKKVKPATVNYYLRTLRAIFTVALEWQVIEENPFKSVRTLKWDAPSPRILTREEVARLFIALQDHAPSYVPLIAFYLMTGMRRTEALRLEWAHVNFDSGVITVARTKGRRPRLIPMAPAARRILLARRELGKPFDWYPSSVNRTFRTVREKAKLEDVTLHDLRRTFGTLLAQAGVSSLFIQQWMGHTDPSVTREHYIGLPGETRRQLKSLRAILPPGL